MNVSIRRYEGLIPDRIKELIKRVEEGFVPIVSAGEEFLRSHLVNAGDGVITTISMFDTQTAAEQSNKAAASWVQRKPC